MRPPLWHPPIELSDPESLIIKRIIHSQAIHVSSTKPFIDI